MSLSLLPALVPKPKKRWIEQWAFAGKDSYPAACEQKEQSRSTGCPQTSPAVTVTSAEVQSEET